MGKYEAIDVIEDWNLNFNLGNAVKYISRAGHKDDIVQDLKKRAKSLKDKTFSVLAYDFMAENFPIKFIDKIVTDLTELAYERTFRPHEFYAEFIEKLYQLKIKVAVLAISKSHDISRFVQGKFDIDRQVVATNFNVYKLKLKG